jgi:peptidyl-prolyl cis-trans isomerase C
VKVWNLGIALPVISAAVRWGRRQPIAPIGLRARLGSVVLLALLVAGSAAALTLDHLAAVPAGSAFLVRGQVVSEQQLADRVKLLGALYGVQPPTDPVGSDRFRRDSAKAVAVSDVLDQAARSRGIVIADKTANDQLTHLIETTFPEGRDAFLQKLAGIGVTQAAMLDEVKRQLADTQLYAQVTKEVPAPSDQDVAQTYEQRRSELAIPEKRHLRNIVVATLDQANQVYAQLARGADFTTVANQSSRDDSTKTKGGDLGTVTRDQLEKLYGDAAFAAAPNSVFGPVQTRYGWNVGQVLEVTPVVPLTLDQAREQLRERLHNERRQDVWNSWLSDQLRSVHVRYADAYRPADPDAAVPNPASQN